MTMVIGDYSQSHMTFLNKRQHSKTKKFCHNQLKPKILIVIFSVLVSLYYFFTHYNEEKKMSLLKKFRKHLQYIALYSA